MPILTAPIDQFQQYDNRDDRNSHLATQLAGPWNDQNIKRIWREPVPTEPPDPAGPIQGVWKAETV